MTTLELPVITTEYTLFGCVAGCAHRRPDVVAEEETATAERDLSGHLTGRVPYISRTITPRCARRAEVAARRQAIYDRANQAVAEVHANGYSFHHRLRKHQEVWDKVTAEYTEGDCPFYEVSYAT